MKRLLAGAMILFLAPFFLFAQLTEVSFDELEQQIQAFADGVASSLPLNSSVGLNWSDAYIGQFPRFGVGITLGASTIPFRAAELVLDVLKLTEKITSNQYYPAIAQFGMPLPAYTLDARIRGLVLPFDAGLKLGILPPNFDAAALIPGFSLEYTNLGFDVRVPLLRESGLLPNLSVGGGYNYLRAKVGFDGVLGGDLEIGDFADPRQGYEGTNYTVTMTDPKVNFQWAANVIDVKAQLSKRVLLFTPYLGVGASVGFGNAGSGFESELQGINAEDIAAINQWFVDNGAEGPLPSLTDTSFSVDAPMTGGWAFRAFGGFSVNLLILRLDLTGMYDFIGRNYGVTLGARVQL